MPMFRKKPVVIEARQHDGSEASVDALLDWINGYATDGREATGAAFGTDGKADFRVAICTLEGTMDANPGDWIIRGIKGEFYPCKRDIFAATYEPAE